MEAKQKGKKMLIVEDDFYINDLYRRNFQNAGYEVDAVSDGQTALDKIRLQTYDLILLDVMIPKITGIELLVAIRAPTSRSKDVPVFIISNLGHDKTIRQAYEAGATGYFLKVKMTPETIVKEIDDYFVKHPQGGGQKPEEVSSSISDK